MQLGYGEVHMRRRSIHREDIPTQFPSQFPTKACALAAAAGSGCSTRQHRWQPNWHRWRNRPGGAGLTPTVSDGPVPESIQLPGTECIPVAFNLKLHIILTPAAPSSSGLAAALRPTEADDNLFRS